MLAPSADSSAGPSVTFWGAAQTVAGSMHLVEVGRQKLLLDCGLVRGPRTHHHVQHAEFPFDPRTIDAVVLSHAHIDHCGNLGHLVRQGFTGPIYCTAATRDLVALMLRNSARIQEEDAHVHQVIGGSGSTEAQPLFTRPDVDRAIEQCIALPYNASREISPDIQVRLVDAGHILGSAMVSLTIAWKGQTGRLTFTGDLGRRGALLVRDPAPVPAADLLLSESTYGGRPLEPPAHAVAMLERVLRTTIEEGGKVLIPAFSLGRTQVAVHALEQAMRAGRVPSVPIYVDSPLAADIAVVYRRYPDNLDPQAIVPAENGEPGNGSGVNYVRSPEQSKELTIRGEPCVIIAPSGMCEGSRILSHLKQHIDDPRCSVVLINYQAPNTPGRRLLERGPTVRIHGRKWNKWARIEYLAGFSGHADRDDLLALLGPLAGQTARVRLVHGEPEQAVLLAAALERQGFADVGIPSRGESVSLF